MSLEFDFPAEWSTTPAPPREPPEADHNRVEGLVNRFIAAKQDALFTAPDAYYRTAGADAVDSAPGALDRLNTLRDDTLAAAGDDNIRAALGPRLDLHIADASDGIDRHVTKQRDAVSRQIISERQTLIQRAAELEHDNDDKLDGLAEANASAAAELARINGEPEAPAIDNARSAVWRTAIGQRLDGGNSAQAVALFDRVKDRLAPADRLSLDTPLQVARADQTADQWIARETATDGPPLKERLDADPDLPPDTKYVVRAKVDARDSAAESKRAATIQELDDQVRDAVHVRAGNPTAYKPGTFARLADAYDAAGEPERAAFARRIAVQDAFLVPFAQASAEKQQRMIDDLPPGELRDTAQALQGYQANAFARDAFAAGTAIYKEVGPPVPIDDIQGRIRQARQITTLRGGAPVVPFTVGEIDGMQRTLATGSDAEKQAVRARLASVPEDMRPTVEGPIETGSNDPPQQKPTPTFRIGAGPDAPPSPIAPTDVQSVVASSGHQSEPPLSEPAPGSDVYRTAEEQVRAQQAKERVSVDRALSQWVSKAQPGSQMPTELVEQLTPAERQQIEGLVTGSERTKTDPNVLSAVINGLKSRNPETLRQWAQTPLYWYRAQLSASDFRKVVELQEDLHPEYGYSRSELAAIRKQLAAKPDTSDLDPFYKALAPDPDVEYGEYLPIGIDSSDRRRWAVLPQSARRFLKGFFDLLKGTKTGELTPEAIDTFTGITGGAGRAVGPPADGATFAAGGKRRPLSEPEKQRARAQLEKNKARARDHEEKIGRHFARDPDLIFRRYITVQPEGGPPTVMDYLTYHRITGKFGYHEGKSSETAGFTVNQTLSHPLIEVTGSVIKGKGKPPFVGGLKLPAEKVQVMRPKDVD